MLPKIQKIPRSLFYKDRNLCKTFKNKLFLLKVVDYQGSCPRVSFSVSKKVSKSAVLRNKLRRDGYRLIREHISKINLSKLMFFSFLRMPVNKEETGVEIKSILIQSGLI